MITGIIETERLTKSHGSRRRRRVAGAIAPVAPAAAGCEQLDFIFRERSLEASFLAQHGRRAVEAH